MLSDAEKREIEAQLAHYEYKRAACVEALSIVQRYQGWVSDESLDEVAVMLDMTPTELDSVATFYNLIFRRPVGQHVILLCDSVSCWIMGYERLLEALTAHLHITLGDTTADGQFTLLPMPCLGTCDHAPALMIDNDLHHDLDPERVAPILDLYRSSGHGTTAHATHQTE
jgi:NADH-quinone oxidoreductase subunit E